MKGLHKHHIYRKRIVAQSAMPHLPSPAAVQQAHTPALHYLQSTRLILMAPGTMPWPCFGTTYSPARMKQDKQTLAKPHCN
jgi:hypothetical protein